MSIDGRRGILSKVGGEDADLGDLLAAVLDELSVASV
jgi:hypothetical protein